MALLTLSLLHLVQGTQSISMEVLLSILFSPLGCSSLGTPTDELIIWSIRLPRLITAVIVGAGLSTAGAALQGLFRNPLADPYVLGFASGGAFGAALAMLLAGPILLGPSLGAFIGSSIAGLLVLMLSRNRAQNELNTILLAGIAVGLVFSAMLSMVLLFAQRQAGELISWLLGNVGQTTWLQISVIALLSFVGFVMIWSHSRALDLISLGVPTARGLGVDFSDFETLRSSVHFCSCQRGRLLRRDRIYWPYRAPRHAPTDRPASSYSHARRHWAEPAFCGCRLNQSVDHART